MKNPLSRVAALLYSVFASRLSALLLAIFAPLVALHAERNYSTPYTFTTIAGRVSVGADDGTATAARFTYPRGMAVDAAGTVYVADSANSTIRKITAAGVVTTFAGSPGSSGAVDGLGTAARFNSPCGIALDGAGNVYVADIGDHTIRKITSAGMVSTLAGAAGVQGSVDGTGSNARFYDPSGVAVDVAGNVYVGEYANCTVRKITPAGVVTTLAGTPQSYGAIDGTGTNARFSSILGLALDSAGNVFVADSGNAKIRKITAAGVVTTVVTPNGQFIFPQGVAVDGADNIYVAETFQQEIQKITPLGVVSVLAGSMYSSGSADGVGAAARFNNPTSLTVDSGGVLFVADSGNNSIRKITSGGVVSTFAGTVSSGTADGTGSAARFSGPKSVSMDAAGTFYVADTANSTIRRVSSGGDVTTFAGVAGSPGSTDGPGSTAKFASPSGLVVNSSGALIYVADTQNNTIRKITSDGVVTTFAGTAGAYGSIDGTGTAARFNSPAGLAIDGTGTVYVADSGNSTIRKITSAGVVSTVAGSAGISGSIDGIGSAARFAYPCSVVVDETGNVFVLDRGNNTVRKITPAGVVTTLAGAAGLSGSSDGAGSAARFNYPSGLGLDGAGNIYVVDRYSYALRRITPTGVVSTIAGGDVPGAIDGTGIGVAFGQQMEGDIAVDVSGNLFVADTDNNLIRKGVPNAPTIATQPVSQTVISGAAVTFSVGVNSPLTPTYQWRKNGANISGATASSYSIASISAGDIASYTVVVTIAGGPAISVPATLSLYTAPAIATQPSNQTVVAGYPVTFAVTASGNPAPTFQWYRDGVTIAGATDSSYTIASVSAIDVGSYNVVATNFVGPTSSASVTLTVDAPMVFTTFVGLAGSSGSIDGAGSVARLSGPSGLTMDAAGNLYVADSSNNTIRKITSGGVVTTIAGTAGLSGFADGSGGTVRFFSPNGVAVDGSGNVFVADSYNNRIRIVRPSGQVDTIAGSGSSGYADGSWFSASFGLPSGVAVDGSGNLYVADTYNDTIRKIAGGMVTTFAGSAGIVGSNDGTGSAARFFLPSGIAVDGSGNVFVADSYNNTIRKITPAGVVTTIAGTAGSAGTTDGIGSAARFLRPQNLCVDGAGIIYVTDASGSTIRKITPAGVVTTLAGSVAGATGVADGIGSAVRFNSPKGIAVDSAGNLYVADSSNSTIRKGVRTSVPVITVQPISQAVTYGTSVTFTATATGTPTPTYQWAKDGVAISGATNATLSFPSVAIADAGSYTLTATNDVGAVISSAATLTVSKAAATVTLSGLNAIYTGVPHAATAVTTPGSLSVDIRYDVLWVTPPTNAGSYQVTATISDANYQGSTTGTLVISKAPATVTLGGLSATYDGFMHGAIATTAPASLGVSFTYNGSATMPTNAGTYAVDATVSDPNYAGSASGSLVIAKASPLITWATPGGIVYGTALSGAQLNASSTVPGAFTYNPASGAILNAGSSSLNTTFAPTDGTNYNSASAQREIIVSATAVAPVFTTQPLSQAAFVGSSVNIATTASGAPAPTYQWQKGGINLSLPSSTSSLLTIPNVQLSDAGSYAVVATNVAGSIISRFARLVVLVPQQNAITYATTRSSTGVTAGGIVNFDYFVTNVGTKTWGAHHYLSIRDVNNTFVAFSSLIGILPGETTTANLNFPAPTTPGTYTYYVQGLEDGVEFFSTQTTVVLTVLAALPNAITYNTTTFPVSAAPGSNVIFTYNVTNTGTATWGANHILSLKNASGTVISSTPLTVLAPGASKTVNLSFTVPSTPGSYNYSVQASQTGVGNFGTQANLTLIALAAQPNAIVYNRVRYPDEVVPGAVLNLKYTLSNAGTQAWGAGHYVSLRDSASNYLAFIPLTGTAVSATKTVEFTLTAPTTPGTYTYYVQALEDGIEFFSTQDVVIITVVALPLGNAVSYNTSTIPVTASPGATVNFAANVTNRGTRAWGATHYLSFRDVDNTFLAFPSLNGVAPGASRTSNLSFTAPTTPGVYTYTLQAFEDGVSFFEMADTVVLLVQ